MKILALSCIHNDIENLLKYLDELKSINFDVIVCPGDFTDTELKGFTRLDLGKLIIEEMRELNKPILVVPGAWDKELIEFFEKEGISIHGKGQKIDDVGFYGFGGAKTPFGLPFEPTEEEIMEGLEKGYKMIEDSKFKIQVTHSPPANTKLDKIFSGAHVGSESVRKFIEEKQPDAAICAHIHEGKGVDEIGKTKIINTGRFPEGYYGLILITDEKVEVKLETLI